jgi:N-methylhydantoinase A
MRYAGQNYELPIPLPDGPIGSATLEALADGFAAAHRRMYGFVAEGEPIQLVTFRVEASGVVPKARFAPQPEAGRDASAAVVAQRDVWLPEEGAFVRCPVYARERLAAGNHIAGPAVVEQMDATSLVLPGMMARVDPYLNLIVESA